LICRRGHDVLAHGETRPRIVTVVSSLAKIIPGMPIGYKNNKRSTPPLTRAQRLRSRAEECRTLADCFTNATCRKQLTELAQSYERMAVAAE
jgi:hypothetical protein